jgi:uncharacterized repeat protein (TIGR04138 family)
MATKDDTEARIRTLVEEDGRYRLDAYLFTLEALNFTLERARRRGRAGHVDGRELLFGIRDLALRHFGFLAASVFAAWGVRTTADFGEIVFRLVDADLLSKQESDSPADFAGVYDFAETFERSYVHPVATEELEA